MKNDEINSLWPSIKWIIIISIVIGIISFSIYRLGTYTTLVIMFSIFLFIGGVILLCLNFPISMSPLSRIPLGFVSVAIGIFLLISVAPWVYEGAYSPNTTFNNFFV